MNNTAIADCTTIKKSSTKRTLAHYVRTLALFSVLLASIATYLYADVQIDSRPIYRDIQSVPPMPVAIVFGAGVGTPVFVDRVNTAIALYKAHKVQKLLVSGDNSHINYDEPQAMKNMAVAAGVAAGDVVCDYAGFRTYDSLYRARDIFGVSQATLVTQAYHLPRAIFLARRLGLRVVGMDAALRSYGGAQSWFNLREMAAVETAWLDIMTHRRPRFLGKREPMFTPDAKT